MTFLALAAAAAGDPSDPTGGLLSYGVLGIVVVCLITGLLVPGYLYKRIEAENDRLRKLVDEKTYPTVEAATSALRESSETLREVARLIPADEPPPRRRRAAP